MSINRRLTQLERVAVRAIQANRGEPSLCDRIATLAAHFAGDGPPPPGHKPDPRADERLDGFQAAFEGAADREAAGLPAGQHEPGGAP